MGKFTMRAFSCPINFIKSGVTKFTDKFPDFLWHFIGLFDPFARLDRFLGIKSPGQYQRHSAKR